MMIDRAKLDAVRLACDMIEMTANDPEVTTFDMQLAVKTLEQTFLASAQDTLLRLLPSIEQKVEPIFIEGLQHP